MIHWDTHSLSYNIARRLISYREHNDKSAGTVTILVFRVIYKDHTHNVFSIGLATLVIV